LAVAKHYKFSDVCFFPKARHAAGAALAATLQWRDRLAADMRAGNLPDRVSTHQPSKFEKGVGLGGRQGETPKRFSLLHDAVRDAHVFAMLVNSDDPAAEVITTAVENTAHDGGYKLIILKATKEDDIDAAFATLGHQKPIALMVIAEPFFYNSAREIGDVGCAAFYSDNLRHSGICCVRRSDETPVTLSIVHRDLIIKLAARHRLPAVYGQRPFVNDGGLICYGPDSLDPFRRAAGYVDRILKGEKPADMPVQAPTKYELVINLRTAKALGLDLPNSVLTRADEVIE
jgi:ABC-type uncharacterized transport system substrate-binding protein